MRLSLPYGKLITALVCASAASGAVMLTGLGVFLMLVFSAVVFFGVYFVLLLTMKERLLMEILQQLFEKLKSMGQ